MPGDELFEAYPLNTWNVTGKPPIPLPVVRIEESVETGLTARRRPYRKGAKIDNLARSYRVWKMDLLFINESEEPGVPAIGNYPAVANDFCDTVDVEETGTLVLATRGPVRAQLKSYTRVETEENRDSCAITVTFWEDNEDSTTAQAFNNPQARSVAHSLGLDCQADLFEAGAFSDDTMTINEMAAALEGLAQAPFDYADDLDAQANAILHAGGRVIGAFSSGVETATSDTSSILRDPENWRGRALLRTLMDTAARAAPSVPAGEQSVKTVPVTTTCSIFDLAAKHGQTLGQLQKLNPSIVAHPFTVPRGTTIRIFG